MSGLLLGTSGPLKAHSRHPQLVPEDIEKGERVLVCTRMQMLLPKRSSVAASPQSSDLFFGRDLHIKNGIRIFTRHFSVFAKWKKLPLFLQPSFFCLFALFGEGCGYEFFMLCSKSHNVALFYSSLLRY